MKTQRSISFCVALFFAMGQLYAQENETEGILIELSDKTIACDHLLGSGIPTVGQLVKVDKKFQKGAFSGTHSLAEGKVTVSSPKLIQISVIKYTATTKENGETRPMAKLNDHIVISWDGPADPLGSSSNDKSAELARIQNNINDAQALIKKRKYKEVVNLIKPDAEKYNDCYACYYVLGRAYYELREHEKAIYQFTTILKHEKQAKKYTMAYIWRARAYAAAYPHQYENAIEDYRTAFEIVTTTADKSFILYQIINLYDKMEEVDSACKAVKELQALEGKNRDNTDFYNHYCLGIQVPKKADIRFDGVVKAQADDKSTLTVAYTKEPLSCYYSSWDGEPDYQAVGDIKEGALLEISSCREKSKMPIAVAKVKSVEGDSVQLEILYWANKINGHPWREEFKVDKPLTFAW